MGYDATIYSHNERRYFSIARYSLCNICKFLNAIRAGSGKYGPKNAR